MKPLETERLLLRPFTPEDEAIHSVVFSDSEVCHFYCRNTRSLEEVRDWLLYRRRQAAQEDLGFLAVVRREDQALRGLGALQPYVASWIVWEDAPERRITGSKSSCPTPSAALISGRGMRRRRAAP